MFDVASGECELVDFLLTRFDPIDLKTKIRFDPSAKVDEQFAPPKEEPGSGAFVPDAPAEPERQAISMQLTLNRPLPNAAQVEAPDPNDGYQARPTVEAVSDGQDRLESVAEEVHEPKETEPYRPVPPPTQPTPPAPGSADWLTAMHRRFQEEVQRYQEEVAVENPDDETA